MKAFKFDVMMICVRVGSRGTIVAGCIEKLCAWCAAPCWVSPASQRRLDRAEDAGQTVGICCQKCAPGHLERGAPVTINFEQLAEAVRTLRGGT